MTGKQLLIIVCVACLLAGYALGWETHARYNANYVRQQQINSYNDGFRDACRATGRTVC